MTDPILVTRRVAARRLSMSLTSFEKYAQPHLRLVIKGSIVRVPVSELDRWVAENAGFVE